MRESPRIRRLRADFRAMEKLRAESSIIDFSVPNAIYGGPPESYSVRFLGRGFWRPERSSETLIRERHEVAIHLGASYPRMMPELAWKSPIFHPNISAGGVVCLGGYSTHWVPSLNLDELCTMLWDMVRYKNFDVESPYNRDAAIWARTQHQYPLPIDSRSIRDKLAGLAPTARRSPALSPAAMSSDRDGLIDDVIVIDDSEDVEIIDAEVISGEDQDILFLD
jgi:hypothetical protein